MHRFRYEPQKQLLAPDVRLLRRGFWAVLSVVVSVNAVAAARARAQELTVESASDGCLVEAVLRERVSHYRAGAPEPAAVRVLVRVVESTTEFELRRGATLLARRSFQRLPDTCPERRDTLALAIAVALAHIGPEPGTALISPMEVSSVLAPATPEPFPVTPESASPAAPPEPVPAAEPGAASPRQVPEQPPSVEPSAAADSGGSNAEAAAPTSEHGSRMSALSVFAGGRYTVAVLPQAALLFAAGAEVGIVRVLAVQVAAFASLPERLRISGAMVRAQALGGELLACARARLDVFAAVGCGGLGAAVVDSRGDGFPRDRRTGLLWLAGLARLALRWPAEAPIAGQLVAGAHASFVRPRMQILRSPAPDVTASIVGGSLGAELVVVLP